MRLPLILFLPGVALALAGCDQLFDKGAKRDFEVAEKKAAAGDFVAAVRLYESSLDGTERTADAHYKLAVIYDEKMNNPLGAQHHFARYLDLAPTGTYATEAKAYKREGELKLANLLNKGTVFSQRDAVLLKNENLALRNRLEALRLAKSMPAATPPAGDKNAQKPIPPGAKTHVVQPGETLASIALKHYKNKARYKQIQEANFYPQSGTPKIKPGQTLVIP